MSEAVLLKWMTGSETLADGSCSLSIFFVQPNGRELFVSKALQDISLGLRRVNYSREPAISGARPEVGGAWATENAYVREGTILKLFGKRRAAWNGLVRQGCLFIQAREGAALQRIRMATLQKTNRSRFAYAEVEGRFDIIPLSEVVKERAVVIPPHLERFYQPSAVAELFEMSVVEPAREQRAVVDVVKVEREDGTTDIMKVRKRIRKLDF